MAKYHIGKNGPAACRASVKPCPLGGEEVHFADKASATKAYEASLASEYGDGATTRKSEANILKAKLKTETPANLDGVLAELYYKEAAARARVNDALANIEKSKKRQANFPEGHPNHTTYVRSIERLRAQVKEQEEVASMAKHEAIPYNEEFQRRGGWSRAFLVSNGNGHVHKDMNCSTCHPTTRYAWMTDYSGKNEDEIVDAAGERACTVCYPSAPVSTLNKPTKMFTEDEKKQQAAREERARVKEEKVAKARAAGIFAEDGGPLKIKGWGKYDEEVKTERSAQSAAVDALVKKRLYARWDAEGVEYNLEMNEIMKAHLEVLVPALARKRGQTPEAVMEDLQKRADSKWKREYQQN